MKVLIIEPGKHPEVKNIEHKLETFQKIVEGHIEIIYPFEDEVVLVCNDEAKLQADIKWNRLLEDYDIIAGAFFICGVDEEDLTDLPDDLLEKYKKKFWNIEEFIPLPNGNIQPIIIRER